jgi:hypothetical protein
MRTEQLSIMVKNLRAEAGHSLSVAQGVNQYEMLKYLLARTQEELWVAFVWPELVLRVQVQVVPGQEAYPWTSALSFDMVRQVFYADASNASNQWTEIAYGIDESMIGASGNASERSDPVRAWDVAGTTSFRVWPTPDVVTTGFVRFKCQRQLLAFTADSDMSTLDDTVIVMFAAAELLARAKAEDAANKLQKAQRHLVKLLGAQISAKHKIASLGGGAPWVRRRYSNLEYGPG